MQRRNLLVAMLAAGGAMQGLHGTAYSGQKSKAKYDVYDLSASESGINDASALSSDGRAVGTDYNNYSTQKRPIVYEVGRSPEIIETATPGQASGINKRGEVIGWLEGLYAESFLWGNGRIVKIPPLFGGNVIARAINDSSQVVGHTYGAGTTDHAFLYENGVTSDLGTWGGQSARAHAINARGDIAGFRVMPYGVNAIVEGVRIIKGRIEVVNGIVGAYEVVPYAINKHGDIAGLMHETSASPSAAFVLIDNKPYKIAEGAEQGIVLSINDHRQAVGGYAFRGQGDRTRAFLWDKGELIDLSGLEEVRQAGWAGLHGAAAINNDGIIVGNGTKLNGNTHAFMLVPKKSKL